MQRRRRAGDMRDLGDVDGVVRVAADAQPVSTDVGADAAEHNAIAAGEFDVVSPSSQEPIHHRDIGPLGFDDAGDFLGVLLCTMNPTFGPCSGFDAEQNGRNIRVHNSIHQQVWMCRRRGITKT